MSRWAKVGKFKVRRVPVPDAVRVVNVPADRVVPFERWIGFFQPSDSPMPFVVGDDCLAYVVDKPRAQSPGTTTKPRTDRIGPRVAVERRVAAARDEIRDPIGALCEELMTEASL